MTEYIADLKDEIRLLRGALAKEQAARDDDARVIAQQRERIITLESVIYNARRRYVDDETAPDEGQKEDDACP